MTRNLCDDRSYEIVHSASLNSIGYTACVYYIVLRSLMSRQEASGLMRTATKDQAVALTQCLARSIGACMAKIGQSDDARPSVKDFTGKFQMNASQPVDAVRRRSPQHR